MRVVAGFLTAVAVVLGSAEPGAAADRDKPHKKRSLCSRAYVARMAVVRMHGERAPGRNICRQGVRSRRGAHAATVREKVRYIRQLRRLVAPPPAPYLVRVAVPPPQAPAGTLSAGVQANGTLEAIAACESGGDPRAVSPDGQYRGKFQFDYGTWAAVGGSGDPAAASEAEQDRRAAILYAQRGAAPWPVCGR
jgi:hypothetical protein